MIMISCASQPAWRTARYCPLGCRARLIGKLPTSICLPAGRSFHWLGSWIDPSASSPGRTRGGAVATWRPAGVGGSSGTLRVSNPANRTRQVPRPARSAIRERERIGGFRGGTLCGDYVKSAARGNEDRARGGIRSKCSSGTLFQERLGRAKNLYPVLQSVANCCIFDQERPSRALASAQPHFTG